MSDGDRQSSAPSKSHTIELSIVPDETLKETVMRIADMCTQLLEAERQNKIWREQMEAQVTLILAKLSG